MMAPEIQRGDLIIINESIPNEKVGTTLRFEGMDDSYADMLYSASNGGTEVSWTFESDYSAKMPWSRYMMAFYRSMLTKSYNEGLDAIDAYVAENPEAHLADLPSNTLNITMEVKEVPGFNAVTANRKGKRLPSFRRPSTSLPIPIIFGFRVRSYLAI